ncbi:hypothetical protein BVRB_3g064400 [Beta vulgaris subsp. vulgaris]|nr:hypothetical protein BVRB_3g064400 [Beta vulgaris subsp. vulgaris]
MTSLEEENEDLRIAAYRGDVKFLRDCVTSKKPHSYYLKPFKSNQYEYLPTGNMFHIGASANKVEFIREAIELLPSEILQELIQNSNEDMENPLHCAAIAGNVEVIKMFLQVFTSQSLVKPWLHKDFIGSTPCYRALSYGHEDCVLEFLKKDKELMNMVNNRGVSLLFSAARERCNKVVMEILKSDHSFSTDGGNGRNAMEYLPRCSESPYNCLHLVVMAANPQASYVPKQNKLEKIALEILDVIINKGWNHLIVDGDEAGLAMHKAPFCGGFFLERLVTLFPELLEKLNEAGDTVLHTWIKEVDTELGTWLIHQTPEFIIEPDNDGDTPLDEAFSVGATWFIEEILKKYPPIFDRAPLCWVRACEYGRYETLKSFITNYPRDFRELCIQVEDSPLHHINRLRSLKEYESFLNISDMKGLINLQDSEKNTPLHKAIEKHNIHLTEALLGLEKINYTIENKEGKTAMDMLAEKCNGGDVIIRWDAMCQRIGINPRINTSFFQQRTDLLEVRNSLFVVAALIATITFAAGFTLPGGLNQNTGEAMMATKAAFLVFLMANTLGMCTSTLVLICLIWSLVHDKSSEVPLLLIEKSMYLLMVAICSTLLAFMTGVFVTISPQNLWPTIVVIIMCSLIGILVERNLLQKVLRIRPTKPVTEHQQHRIFRGVSIVNACLAFVKKLQFQRIRKNEEHEETSNLV